MRGVVVAEAIIHFDIIVIVIVGIILLSTGLSSHLSVHVLRRIVVNVSFHGFFVFEGRTI